MALSADTGPRADQRSGRSLCLQRPRRPSASRIAAGLLAAAIAASPLPAAARAAPQGPASPPPATHTPALPAQVETWHSITLGQHSLQYRAIAETLPLIDARGVETASVFTISYLAKTSASRPRPVSFVFNGGPGAASVFLHLGALGPRILDTPESGAAPTPPVRLIDNPSSWLGFTDLVFVDPVGTGFSQGKGKGENPDKQFYNVRADLRSLDAVVRLWLTRHQRWDSPVYLVGESYGGFRVAAMAESLARHVGVTATGLILISPALDLSVLRPSERDLIAAAVELPSYAACTAVLAGGAGDARDAAAVERFALSDYLVGLAGLKGVPAPGDPFIARIARITGISPDVVRRHRGRLPSRVFAREIRRSEGEVVSIYDGTVARPAPGAESGSGDPVLAPTIAAYTAAFDTYAPQELGYRTDLPYRVLPRDISQQWNWQGADEGQDGLGLALSSLQAMLLQHPKTKVLIANGRYDLVTPYLASRWLVDQLAVPDAVRAGIRLRVYDGGHMMYMRPSARTALAHDAAALYLAGGAPPE